MSNANLIMFYDTETTDVWDFKASYDAEHQPNLIQLGYKIYESQSRTVVAEIGVLVNSAKFDTWRGISEGAQNVHKISEEIVRNWGYDPALVMNEFVEWADRCQTFVAHNEQFDNRIMQCFSKRAGFSPDVFGTKSKFCTMQFTTNICKIPSPKGKGFKWPKLDEAYRNLVDKNGFSDAHNALADVNACADIFWKLVDKGLIVHDPESNTYGGVNVRV